MEPSCAAFACLLREQLLRTQGPYTQIVARATFFPYAVDMESSLHDARLTLAGLFFEAHAGLASAIERRLQDECGLAPQWFEVMIRLARTPGLTLRMSDLAAQMTLSPSGLTRVVDRLEAEGFVERRSCPSDRRGQNAVLTPTGLQRIESAVPKHLEHLEELFVGVLSSDERDDLERIMRKVRDASNPGSTAGACPTARPT
jgi:DNA-binding MarR family transcriptional regulator